jgi:hypothetical protein
MVTLLKLMQRYFTSHSFSVHRNVKTIKCRHLFSIPLQYQNYKLVSFMTAWSYIRMRLFALVCMQYIQLPLSHTGIQHLPGNYRGISLYTPIPDVDKMCWKEWNADEQARFISSCSNFESHHSKIDKNYIKLLSAFRGIWRSYFHVTLIILLLLLLLLSGLENRQHVCGDSLHCSHDTLYPQKLAQTSPTCGGRSIGIVCLRTQATEL